MGLPYLVCLHNQLLFNVTPSNTVRVMMGLLPLDNATQDSCKVYISVLIYRYIRLALIFVLRCSFLPENPRRYGIEHALIRSLFRELFLFPRDFTNR
jgi:hypothetical protein